MTAERFAASARIYGLDRLELFRRSHVAVIGIGGVGSWAAEALARNAIGKLTLIDHDRISESNINRQIHSMNSTLGAYKVEQMAERIVDINPDCQLNPIAEPLLHDNCQRFIDQNIHFVIDAIDSVRQKTALLAFCKRLKIPVITTGAAGGMSDPAKICITDLSRTYNDALASKVRYGLRSQYGFSRNPKHKFGIDCVFSSEQPKYPQPDGTIGHDKPKAKGLRLDCYYGYGSSVCITSGFGMMAAAAVLNKLKD